MPSTSAPDAFPVIAIGASAGGVEALRALLAALDGPIQAAVLVVVHMPAHSPSQLDSVLARATGMPVVRARDGDPLQPGRIVVSVPDRHLMVEGDCIRVTQGPRECRVRPAIDVLFRSVAMAYGPRTVGVVLSGMLDDGTAGLWAIKDRHGQAWVQDPAEALHPGMPQSALDHLAVDRVGPVATLAAEMRRLAGAARPLLPSVVAPTATQGLEIKIAAGANAMHSGVMGLGRQSRYTCPDCHGVLMQIDEGSIVRFRCHTGHAFSAMTLTAEVNEAVDNSLWATIRALEERQMLSRQLGELAADHGRAHDRQVFETQAEALDRHIHTLRGVALSSDF